MRLREEVRNPVLGPHLGVGEAVGSSLLWCFRLNGHFLHNPNFDVQYPMWARATPLNLNYTRYKYK